MAITALSQKWHSEASEQWLNEVPFFNQAFEQVESKVLRNYQLFVAQTINKKIPLVHTLSHLFFFCDSMKLYVCGGIGGLI